MSYRSLQDVLKKVLSLCVMINVSVFSAHYFTENKIKIVLNSFKVNVQCIDYHLGDDVVEMSQMLDHTMMETAYNR
jgi:hypothetical protein